MKYKNTVLEEHKRDESYNSVLISPALGTGVDLPDELSRFQIIVKTPYLDSENDKRIKKIFEIQPDRYFLKSVFTFVQNAGRSIRSKTDYAETFVLDTRIHQLLNYQRNQLPKWFLESINRGKS
jgi:Rad3-related DNA helicase